MYRYIYTEHNWSYFSYTDHIHRAFRFLSSATTRILRSIFMIISLPSSAIRKALCPRFANVKEKSDKWNPKVEMGQKRNAADT